MKTWQVLAIAVAVALIAPLVLSWATEVAPLLALVGICVAGGVVIHWAVNMSPPELPTLKPSLPKVAAVPVAMPQMAAARPMGVTSPTHDVLPLDTLPKKHNALLRLWLWLWNHPNHAAVMLGCAAWIICPLDGDIVFIAGWFDDLAAFALFCKHARDLYEIKWGKPPERLISQKTTELISQVRDKDLPVLAVRPERVTSKLYR